MHIPNETDDGGLTHLGARYTTSPKTGGGDVWRVSGNISASGTKQSKNKTGATGGAGRNPAG